MAREAAKFFAELSQIAGICPDCKQVFRLSDARLYRHARPLPSVLDSLEKEQAAIDRALDRLETAEEELRAQARVAGLNHARRRLRKIDGMFSKLRLNPHDAKVLFDPVDFVVFDGMAKGSLRKLILLSRPPSTKAEEKVCRSVENVVASGNFAFKTVRLSNDGRCAIEDSAWR
jgi:predicted Holliday junction resolvase-like endonuclease